MAYLHKFRKKDGTTGWQAKVYVKREGGVQKRLSRNFHDKGSAEQWAAQQTTKKATGTLAIPSRQTVSDFFEQWLKDYAKGNVAPTTYHRYDELIRLHLTPAFGTVRLQKLGPQNITSYFSREQAEGKLSGTTLLHLHRLLHKTLKDAVVWGVLSANPVDRTKAPRPAEFEPVVFDVEMARVFLAEARRSSPYYRIYLFASLGLRSGELGGLQWDAVNLLTGQVSIVRKLYRLKGKPLISEPKTRYGRRGFILPGVYLDELRRLKKEQDAAKASLEDRYEDHNLVFCQTTGKPLWMGDVERGDFKRVLKRCGLNPKMRLHDLRHSAASILAALAWIPLRSVEFSDTIRRRSR